MIHLFLHLPEMLLEQQQWKILLADLTLILKSARKDRELRVYYDSENVKRLVSHLEEHAQELYIKSPRNALGGRLSFAANWREKQQHQGVYYRWLPDQGTVEQVTALSFAEAACRAKSGEEVVLINLDTEQKYPSPLSLFPAETTPTFIHLELKNGVPEYQKWYGELQKARTFSLENNPDFELTTISPVQGQKVYRHKRRGTLWYKDNFHKNHYEVFDKTGRVHLGEANERGQLDRSKADPDKKPIG